MTTIYSNCSKLLTVMIHEILKGTVKVVMNIRGTLSSLIHFANGYAARRS